MQERISKYISFAASYDEFLNILDQHIQSENFCNNIPTELLQSYHWDNLFNEMISKIKKIHGFEL